MTSLPAPDSRFTGARIEQVLAHLRECGAPVVADIDAVDRRVHNRLSVDEKKTGLPPYQRTGS